MWGVCITLSDCSAVMDIGPGCPASTLESNDAAVERSELIETFNTVTTTTTTTGAARATQAASVEKPHGSPLDGPQLKLGKGGCLKRD